MSLIFFFFFFLAMVRSVLLDKEGWTKNVMLDPDTGLDPPGYKVRAVSGKISIKKER